jgi:ADP-ribosylglycohydrolase
MGWAKIAFTYSFNFLKNAPDNRNDPKFYESVISQMIKEAGDTDTNAAILGGLIGAYVGYNSLPDFMKDRILAYDTADRSLGGNHVLNFLLPKYHLCRLILAIYKHAP